MREIRSHVGRSRSVGSRSLPSVSGSGVVLLVVLSVGGVGLIQAAIWIPLIRKWRRRSAAFDTALQAEMLTSGERTIMGPERAIYRGATMTYGSVKGNGTILLTDRRLLFRKITGGVVEVPVAKITATRQESWFLRSKVGGRTHLVVETNDPAEVGFFVTDLAAWERALASLRAM